MNVIYKNISELKPYKNNTKKHPKEQVERIAESIRQFGFTQPVLVDKNNVVVAGHGRILGAKKAGLKQVPVVCMEDLTEEQITAYRLVDNKLNESDWDFNLLDMEIENIIGIDMQVFGFGSDETKNVITKEVKFNVKKENSVTIMCKDSRMARSLYSKMKMDGYICKLKTSE